MVEEKNQSDTKDFESSWNLSQAIIIEVSQNLQDASRHYIIADLEGAFYRLKAVQMRLVQYLSEDEKVLFAQLENEINIHIAKSKPKGFETNKEMIMHRVYLSAKYDKYNSLIMMALKKYGMLIPSKEDKTGLTA